MLAQNIDKTKPAQKKGLSQYGTSHINNLKLNYIQRSLYSKDESVAFLNCTFTDHPLKEIEFILFNQICNIIEEGLTEGFILNINPIAETGILLKEFLDGKITKTDNFISGLQKHGLSENTYYNCLCLRILDSESGVVLSKFITANIHYYLPNTFVCTLDNDIILLHCSSNKEQIYTALTDLKNLLQGCNYFIGISNTFTDIENIKYYYYQAQIAIDSHLKSDTANNMFFFFQFFI